MLLNGLIWIKHYYKFFNFLTQTRFYADVILSISKFLQLPKYLSFWWNIELFCDMQISKWRKMISIDLFLTLVSYFAILAIYDVIKRVVRSRWIQAGSSLQEACILHWTTDVYRLKQCIFTFIYKLSVQKITSKFQQKNANQFSFGLVHW